MIRGDRHALWPLFFAASRAVRRRKLWPIKRVQSFRNALIVLAALGGWPTWASASATGGLSGTVVDAETSLPVAGVQVTAESVSN
jgi:hypothetical protein